MCDSTPVGDSAPGVTRAGRITSFDSSAPDRFSGQSKGFGFVRMASEKGATLAVQRLDNFQVGHRWIRSVSLKSPLGIKPSYLGIATRLELRARVRPCALPKWLSQWQLQTPLARAADRRPSSGGQAKRPQLGHGRPPGDDRCRRRCRCDLPGTVGAPARGRRHHPSPGV